MTDDRRRRPSPATAIGHLEQLPALVLLNRLPIPMLAVSDDGCIVFANPACQDMLGDTAVANHPLNNYLHTSVAGATDSVAQLRHAAGTITDWQHAGGGTIKAVVSQPMLMRAKDPILLVGLTDVTEWLWTTGEA